MFAKFVTCDTANAKVACEASHSFIHKSFVPIKIFDPTLQLVHDSWFRCLPRALATISKFLFAQCLVLTERGCQRFKCAPHTLDHFDMILVNAERRDNNRLWKNRSLPCMTRQLPLHSDIIARKLAMHEFHFSYRPHKVVYLTLQHVLLAIFPPFSASLLVLCLHPYFVLLDPPLES